jgi:nucleoside-diphosphate-sugar epimerase/phosphohistidine swiveling domain-containing protein
VTKEPAIKIVVTGVSGLLGRTTAALLAGQGHEVVGVSRSRPLELPRGVRHVNVDVRDRDALAEVVAGAASVLHCAFMLDGREGYEAMRAVNVDGTANVVAAAESAGAARLVFVSSATVYGPRASPGQPGSTEDDPCTPHPEHPYARQKLECEAVLAASHLENLSVRASIILGRGTDNRLQEAMAMSVHVAARGPDYRWQLMHHDDAARFLALAVQPGQPTGIVNIAGAGSVSARELASVLGRRSMRVPPGAMYGVAKVAGGLIGISPGEVGTSFRMPALDTARMRDEFGFEPAWDAQETAADTVLAVHGNSTRGLGGKGVTVQPGRVPYRHQILPAEATPADGAALQHPGTDHAGEFDTPIDPRFPVYSQTNLSEALPGPSSPLTIDIMGRALRGTTSAVADLLHLPDVLHLEASSRLQGLFGHRFFINASGTYQVGIAMPGTNPEQLIDQYAGRHAQEMPGGREAIAGSYRATPTSTLVGTRRLTGVGRNVIAALRSASAEVDRVAEETARLEKIASNPATLSDARLAAAILLSRDLLAHAWTVQGLVNLVSGATLTLATRGAESKDVGHGDDLASGAALRGVRTLAAEVAADPTLSSLLADASAGVADRLRDTHPEFWARVQDALAEFGHRGPAEVELDARTFSEDVPGFLRTVQRASVGRRRTETPTGKRRRSPLVSQAQRMLAVRERNRDRCVRLAWLTRRLVLEQGRRLVSAGRLITPEDVYYLTVEAILDPPADAQTTVARRRAERDRLRGLHMPPIFNGEWQATGASDRAREGTTLQGIGISGGTITGRVRIVDPDTVDDFEDDEVLVSHVTDVGYTPLFALSAAVVTDIGGEMSHAAVVAREYGVPCVVDTQVAAASLRTGDLVEVDGRAGTVRLVEAAATEQA